MDSNKKPESTDSSTPPTATPPDHKAAKPKRTWQRPTWSKKRYLLSAGSVLVVVAVIVAVIIGANTNWYGIPNAISAATQQNDSTKTKSDTDRLQNDIKSLNDKVAADEQAIKDKDAEIARLKSPNNAPAQPAISTDQQQALDRLGYSQANGWKTNPTSAEWANALRNNPGLDVQGTSFAKTPQEAAQAALKNPSITGTTEQKANPKNWVLVYTPNCVQYGSMAYQLPNGTVQWGSDFVECGSLVWVNIASGGMFRLLCDNALKQAPVKTTLPPSFPKPETPVSTPPTPPITTVVQEFEKVCRNGVDNVVIVKGTKQPGDLPPGSEACKPKQPAMITVCRPGVGDNLTIPENDKQPTDRPVGDITCHPQTPKMIQVCRPGVGDNLTILESDMQPTDKPVGDIACHPVQPKMIKVCRPGVSDDMTIPEDQKLPTDLPIDSPDCHPKSSNPADYKHEDGAPLAVADPHPTPPAQTVSTTEPGGRGGTVTDTVSNHPGTETGVTAPGATAPNPTPVNTTTQPNEGGTPTNAAPVVAGDAIDGPTTPAPAAHTAAPVVQQQAAPAQNTPKPATQATPAQQVAPAAKAAPAPAAQVVAAPAPAKQATATATVAKASTSANAAAPTAAPATAAPGAHPVTVTGGAHAPAAP